VEGQVLPAAGGTMTIGVYADAGGHPGTQLLAHSGTPTGGPVDAPPTVGVLYPYVLALPTALELPAGRYWLGVRATGSTGSEFFFRLHEPAVGSQPRYTEDGGATWITYSSPYQARDLAFALLEPARSHNSSPTITSVTPGTADPIALVAGAASTSIAVAFTDPDAGDSHTVAIDCDASTTATVDHTVSGATSGVTRTCAYVAPGVYTVRATVADAAGASATAEYRYVVVYDAAAGFVTGGGWIAYAGTACPVLCGGAAGRATFGFSARYQPGAAAVTGGTRFEFHAGTMAFVSTSYDWLVVGGGRAQYRGRGTINGAGDYAFLLTAVDGTPDRLRMKIVDRRTGDRVFDNQWGADETGAAATALDRVSGGGNIIIHTR
jgi:hypothetical protein